MNQKKLVTIIVILSAILSFGFVNAHAHCQIPCGIYNDHARVDQMLEDTKTILKAAKLIQQLSDKSDPQSKQQLVRWVLNKETHAQNVISTIGDYFLTQRVKPDQKDYVERLKKHHAVIIAAMKAKQNSDPGYAVTLQKAIEDLAEYYPAN